MHLGTRAIRGLIVGMATALALSAQADGTTGERHPTSMGIKLGEVWPGSEKKLYSHANEELIIRDFFEDRRDGFFLDVGCSTPIKYSTTYYLEKHLGWSGIGIDALAEHARKYKRKRPKTKFFNYFVTDQSETNSDFYRVGAATGLSSGSKDGVFISKLKTEKLSVPSITLNKLLEQNGVTKIDFMSIDIEGEEPKALAGFDIDKYQPELICIENPGTREFVVQYFADHGYVRLDKYLKYDFVNWYYVRAGNAALGTTVNTTTDGIGDTKSR